MSDYLTDREVAEKFGISREQVQDRCRAREWPHMRVGQAYRFKAEHIAAIEALCEVPVKAPTAASSWGLAPGRRSA